MATALDIARSAIGQRETNGKNRSAWIDAVNKRAGVPMGSPYCASALTDWIIKAGGPESLRTAGSQAFRRWADREGRLFTLADSLKKCRGAAFGWTNNDQAHGHVGIIAARFTADGRVTAIGTIEANSNPAGSRDGDGVFENKRAVPIDRGHRLWFVDLTGIPGCDWWDKPKS